MRGAGERAELPRPRSGSSPGLGAAPAAPGGFPGPMPPSRGLRAAGAGQLRALLLL